ncbi:NUDIX hydrolase [Pseudomonas coronafaciens]|uniref:NUDIX hydrolase n=1 Tax=Pseudomonas coronafaciens TaxID=53409 RepID=UPI0006E6B675|nr:NUDIX domain-containing protein [Pseudomonas coronafaciens]KPZ27403.1 hypothetical protein ALO38_200014 [Pseudomonas coronafaciens pv. zizaniae]
MINPIKYNFSHPGFSAAQNPPAPAHQPMQGPSVSSNWVPNFISRGRGKSVPLSHFNTADEHHLADRQHAVLQSIEGNKFMRVLQKYTAAETTNTEFAFLRDAIPRYSIELAKPCCHKVLYRGISLDKRSALDLLKLPHGYYSRELAHGLVHGMPLANGGYTGRGVASASTVSAISRGFALLNAEKKNEIQVLFVLKAMGPVPALRHSGAKGVTLSTSRLPSSVAGKSEHEVILDITNRYEVTQAYPEGDGITVEMTVLGRSKRAVELAAPETDKWEQLSRAKGSNPGGLFRAPNGIKWYVKTGRLTNNYTDNYMDRFRNELLASRLYIAAGIDVPEIRLALRDGKTALISRVLEGNHKGVVAMARSGQLMKGFAVDAWLANWDVAGLDLDNILFTQDHTPVRIDLGGAMIFRAGGERKGSQFSATPMELVTMLSRKDNTSSRVFQYIERDQIRAGITAIEQIADVHIRELCLNHGPGNSLERAALGEMLIRRKKWLVSVKQELPHIHPRKNEHGQVVTVKTPTSPTMANTWNTPDRTAVFVPHHFASGSLNNIPFTSWRCPETLPGWRQITTRAVKFREPEFQNHGHLHPASGAVIFEPDGRIWVTEPTNHVFGTAHSLPKGKQETGLNLRTNAVKEVYEETGLRVELHGFIGDYDRTTSRTRYYLARRIGGTPSDMGFESQSVKLARLSEANKLLSSELDTAILLDAAKVFQKASFH